jgi:hypothetical protein
MRPNKSMGSAEPMDLFGRIPKQNEQQKNMQPSQTPKLAFKPFSGS